MTIEGKIAAAERFIGNPLRLTRRTKPDDASSLARAYSGPEAAYDGGRAYRDIIAGVVLINIPTGVTQAVGLALILKGTAHGVRSIGEMTEGK